MAVDESDFIEELKSSTPTAGRRKRRRTRSQWSPDQLLDPLVLLGTAPMAIFPDRFPREAFIVAGILLVIPYVVRKSNSGRFFAPTPLVWPVLALYGIILPLSAWRSPSFWIVSWEEFVRFTWGMAVMLGVVNWSAANAAHLHGDGRQSSVTGHVTVATAGWFALGSAFSAVGLLAIRTSNKIPMLSVVTELLPDAAWLPQSVMQGFNANRVAGLVVLFFPFAVAMALGPSGRKASRIMSLGVRIIMLGLVLFFGVALLLTQSRAALLAVFVALVVVSVLAGWRGLIPLMIVLVVAVATLSVFGAAGLVDALSVGVEDGGRDTIWQQVMADRNVAGRLVIWRRALHGIADEPLTGMGLAGFEAYSQTPYPKMTEWRPDPDVVHAHNWVLQAGLDVGLPGMMLLLAVVGIAVWEAVRLFQFSRASTPARFWAVGAVGALTAFGVYNMLDVVSVGARPAVSYWFLFGLVAGAGAALRMAQESEDARNRA